MNRQRGTAVGILQRNESLKATEHACPGVDGDQLAATMEADAQLHPKLPRTQHGPSNVCLAFEGNWKGEISVSECYMS